MREKLAPRAICEKKAWGQALLAPPLQPLLPLGSGIAQQKSATSNVCRTKPLFAQLRRLYSRHVYVDASRSKCYRRSNLARRVYSKGISSIKYPQHHSAEAPLCTQEALQWFLCSIYVRGGDPNMAKPDLWPNLAKQNLCRSAGGATITAL